VLVKNLSNLCPAFESEIGYHSSTLGKEMVRVSHVDRWMCSLFVLLLACTLATSTFVLAQENPKSQSLNTSTTRVAPDAQAALLKKLVARYSRTEFAQRSQIAKEIAKLVANDPKALNQFLSSGDEDIRAAGAEVASVLGPKAAPIADSLGRVIEQHDPYSSSSDTYAAAEALIAIGPEGFAVVRQLLKSSKFESVLMGSYVIEHLGPKGAPLVSDLINLLSGDDNDLEGGDAISALAAIGEPAIYTLCSVVGEGIGATEKSPSYQASWRAAFAIRDMKANGRSAIPCLLSALHASSSWQREAVIEALGSVGQNSAIVAETLSGYLDDADPDVRRRAAISLKDVGDVAYNYLKDVLAKGSENAKYEAIMAVSWLGEHPQTIPILRLAAQDRSPEVRFFAVQQLASYNHLDDELTTNLLGVFPEGNVEDRREAVTALAKLHKLGPNAEAVLTKAVGDSDEEVQAEALKLLATDAIASQHLLKPLLQALVTRNMTVQQLLYHSIAQSGSRAVVGLCPLLISEDSAVRFNAVSSLILLGRQSEPCSSQIIDLANDPDFDIRSAALSVLRQLGKPAIDLLVRQLQTPSRQIPTLDILAALGPDASGATTAMSQLLNGDSSPKLRLAVIKALAELGPGASSAESKLRAVWTFDNPDESLAIAEAFKAIGPKVAKYNNWAKLQIRDQKLSSAILISLIESLDTKDVGCASLLLDLAVAGANSEVRAAAIRATARAQPSLLTPDVFRQLLKSNNVEVELSALETIQSVPLSKKNMFVREIIHARTLSEGDVRVRAAAISLLDGFDCYECATYILGALRDVDPEIRTAAMLVLRPGHWKDPIISEVRTITLFDSVPELRQLGVKTLGRFGGRDSIPTLVRAAQDPSRLVAIEAVTVLKRFGDRASLEMLASEWRLDSEVEFYIYEALEQFSHRLYFSAPAFSGFDESYPRMDWPPKRFTDRLTFDKSQIGEFRTTLGDYCERVMKALQRAEYPAPNLYAIPGGFAIVTMPERFLEDGSAVIGLERWTSGKLPLGTADLEQYLKRLFLGTTGHFRWFVFFATRQDFGNVPGGPDLDEARRWAEGGFSRLPEQIASEQASNYLCGVLLFEFSVPDGSRQAQFISVPSIDAARQLSEAGLYERLFPTYITKTSDDGHAN
jgi:HEAT repeat protein